MSSLDTFFYLNNAADFYVSLHILSIEVTEETKVRVEADEVAQVARNLCTAGFLRRLRYNVDKQVYEPFLSNEELGEKDWFEITAKGRNELDRLYIES